MAFNLAIIGFGGMAGWHWENIIREMPGITIVGGYDVREKAFADMRDKGLKTYQTPEELYADQSIDVVLIATPNNFHKPYSIACLEAGKHVICEKPVTLNAMELEEILAVSKKTGKFFTAHQNRRWDTDYLSMRGVYESGILARPYLIESRVQSSNGLLHGWRCFKQNGGGMVLDWGVHLIDQMLDFIKEPLIEVYAHLHSIIADEVDDVVMAEFRFESGLAYIVNVSMNCFITQPRWHACSIDGSLMVENWDADGRITKNTSEEGVEWAETIVYTAAGPTRSMAPRPQNTLENYKLPVVKKNCCYEYYSNIDAVVNNKAHLIVTPEQMTRVMKAIDAVFESDRLKRSVHLYHAAL